MLQNPCKTLGFKKNMVYKIPPRGEVNHIQPVAYMFRVVSILCLLCLKTLHKNNTNLFVAFPGQ